MNIYDFFSLLKADDCPDHAECRRMNREQRAEYLSVACLMKRIAPEFSTLDTDKPLDWWYQDLAAFGVMQVRAMAEGLSTGQYLLQQVRLRVVH